MCGLPQVRGISPSELTGACWHLLWSFTAATGSIGGEGQRRQATLRHDHFATQRHWDTHGALCAGSPTLGGFAPVAVASDDPSRGAKHQAPGRDRAQLALLGSLEQEASNAPLTNRRCSTRRDVRGGL